MALDMVELGLVDEAGLGRTVAEQEPPQRHPGGRQHKQHAESQPPVEPGEQVGDDRAADRQRQWHGQQRIAERRRPFMRRQPVGDRAGQRREVGSFRHAQQHARRVEHGDAGRQRRHADRQAPQNGGDGEHDARAPAIDGEAAQQGGDGIAQAEGAQDGAALGRREAELALDQRDGIGDRGAVDVVDDGDRKQKEDDEPAEAGWGHLQKHLTLRALLSGEDVVVVPLTVIDPPAPAWRPARQKPRRKPGASRSSRPAARSRAGAPPPRTGRSPRTPRRSSA